MFIINATIFFNVHITDEQTAAILTSMKYDDPTTGIHEVYDFSDKANNVYNVYTISGTLVKRSVSSDENQMGLQPGLYIINGKKVIVR